MRLRRVLPGLIAMLLLASACGQAPAAAPPARSQAVQSSRVITTPTHPFLAYAIAHGKDLGPIDPATVLHLTFGLRGRNQAQLDALLASGRHVSAAQYAVQFGPDPQAVATVQSTLRAASIAAQWVAGSQVLSVTGRADAVERLLGVRIDNRIGPDGVRFHAPALPPAVPSAMSGTVNAITGLDDYPRASAADIRSPNGVSPGDMMDFYDVTPLTKAGLDGSGMTVVFPEIDMFDPAMLDAYAAKFHLPAFNVQVAPMNFGQPSAEQGEADLDLEIVHAIAPAAKEVVYYAAGDMVAQAEQQMYKDFPNGAIESSSVGACEAPGKQNQNDATVLGDLQQPAAAKGWSMFVATGDRGAYDCAPDGDFNDVAADLDASIPYVTAVGGTLVFLSANGGYFKEASWGEPIEQWGGSGGVSEYWPIPSWQKGPGVQNQFSNGMRQTPDVSGNADSQSGWDIFAQGQEQKVGGTSAAAPFWAACAALIDQDLKQKNLPLMGFADPALYTFAQSPAGLPAAPFHDVTTGTNLYYPATPNYDLATGLGSADMGALAVDFEWYETNHPSG